jgi:DNA-binding NarL/FixJ family response regulator
MAKRLLMNIHMGTESQLPFPLRGRRVQIDALRDQLDAVQAGRGGTVLVIGMAGMGKTVLLDAAESMARKRGITVFRGTGHVAAQMIPFGPLLDALVSARDAPVDPAVLRNLSQSPDQRFWLLRELQEALERAALRGPVLIAIDDVQWADEATLAALVTLTRQLATHQILWLLAVRSGEPFTLASSAVGSIAATGALKITLLPLDRDAVTGIAGDLLGATPDQALQEVLAGVRGQPFLLTELLRGMREENLVEVSDGIARLTGTRIPLRFVDSVNNQLGRLSAGARDALQMASVLGRRFSADELAGLTDTTQSAILGALREGLAAGLVTEDGDRIAFRHDLVREAVEGTLPETVRQSLRRRAIDVMLRHGAPPSDVAELVMDVAQPGDAQAVAILRRAAAETGRVSPAIASELSRRALDLAPPDDPVRGPLTAETVNYLIYAGQAADAGKLITAAAGDLADPVAEAQARLSLAHISLQYAPTDVVEHCQRALALPGLPVELRTYLLSFLSLGLDMSGDISAAGKAAGDAAEAARASGDPANEVFTLVPQASQALGRGDWRLALDLAGESAARRNTARGPTVRLWLPDAWQALIAIAVARLDDAFAIIDAGMKSAQRDGMSANMRVWSMIRFRALFSSGQLADARAEAEATIEMADEIGGGSYGYVTHLALYTLGRVALHTGDPAGIAQARRSAALLSQARESPPSQSLGAWLTALLNDADSSGTIAAHAPVQVIDPLAHGPLSENTQRMYADGATLTRILLNAGRRADAESAVAHLENFAAQRPDFPFLDSAVLHARAVLDADPDTALRAVTLSDGDPRPLVRAAVLEDAGRLLPEARTAEAVPLLETALASYAAAGAERDSARVRSLLRARGVRQSVGGPRSAPDWPELTESEFAVVSLVAHGSTNREVADHLYVSPYTVSTHLRHVFTKLGIRSRVELARLAVTRGMTLERCLVRASAHPRSRSARDSMSPVSTCAQVRRRSGRGRRRHSARHRTACSVSSDPLRRRIASPGRTGPCL